MINIACACPTDCEDNELPDVKFNDCVEAFEEELSQICDLLISVEDPENPGEALYKPTDINDPDAWIAVIAQTGAGVRRLTGIGSLPKGEANIRDISKLRRKVGKKNYTLTFTIDEMTDENYEFLRKMGCGRKIVMWFVTLGGKLYGGDDGFSATIEESDPIFDADQNAYVNGELVLTWKSKCAPPRTDWPLSEDLDNSVDEPEDIGGGG